MLLAVERMIKVFDDLKSVLLAVKRTIKVFDDLKSFFSPSQSYKP